MADDSFLARPYGMIQLHSLGIAFPRFTREDLNGPYKRHSRNGKFSYDRVRWQDVSPPDRRALLTDLHELDHFRMLISTPFGVLLWRLYQVVTRDLLFLTRTYREYGLPLERKDFSSGIVEWFRRTGRTRLDLVAPIISGGLGKVRYIEGEVIPGLESVLRLLDILTCHAPHEKYRDLTAGEFAALLNIAYDYLSQRSDIELRNDKWGAVWKSENPRAPMFDGPASLSFLLVMELLAYCRERRVVRRMGGSAADLSDWGTERLPGVYRPAMTDWLSAAGDDETTLREVLIDSLLGRVDPAAIGSCPGWDPDGCGNETLDQLYRGLKSRTERTNDGRLILYVECEWPWGRALRVSDSLGMQLFPTLRSVLTLGCLSGRKRLYGPKSRWDAPENEAVGNLLAESTGAKDPYGIHLRRLDDVLRQGLGARYRSVEGLLHGRPPTLSDNDLTKHLLLVEYQDEIDFYTETTTSTFFDAISAAFFGVMTSLSFHLTTGLPPPDPELVRAKLVGSIDRFLRVVDDSAIQLKELAELYRKIVELLFTKGSFEKLMSVKIW